MVVVTLTVAAAATTVAVAMDLLRLAEVINKISKAAVSEKLEDKVDTLIKRINLFTPVMYELMEYYGKDRRKLDEAQDLVNKCSDITRWDFYKMSKYGKRLREMDSSLQCLYKSLHDFIELSKATRKGLEDAQDRLRKRINEFTPMMINEMDNGDRQKLKEANDLVNKCSDIPRWNLDEMRENEDELRERDSSIQHLYKRLGESKAALQVRQPPLDIQNLNQQLPLIILVLLLLFFFFLILKATKSISVHISYESK